MDCVGSVGRLHGLERSEMVLVAVQRLGLFLGHGHWPRQFADCASAVPATPCHQYVPDHPWRFIGRLLDWNVPDASGRGASPEGLLPAGAALGFLGTGL